jgi:hypothetical protein
MAELEAGRKIVLFPITVLSRLQYSHILLFGDLRRLAT